MADIKWSTIVAEYNTKNGLRHIIKRDDHGKWSVDVNGTVTQKRLTAKEIVRYLANALEGK